MAIGARLAKYKELLINLLPLGRLWRPQDQPVFSDLLQSTAVELCRVDERAEQMQKEVDPCEAFETLDQWEAILGIPDECTPEDQTLEERRNQIKQKLTSVGGLSKTYYEFICSQLGFEVEVTNWLNFVAGRSVAGDPLTNYFNNTFVAGSPAGMQLKEVGWKYCFNVELPATAAEFFVAGSLAGDPLRLFSNELIECTIKRLKPAHSCVTFTFKE